MVRRFFPTLSNPYIRHPIICPQGQPTLPPTVEVSPSMLWILASLMAQIGVDAGPAPASCGGSIVTLAASPINPPARFEIQWEDAPEPGIFLVVTPLETTEYRVFLTDLDTDIVYEATTRVLVHPGSPDLFSDGILDSKDWGQWYAAWGEAPPDEARG